MHIFSLLNFLTFLYFFPLFPVDSCIKCHKWYSILFFQWLDIYFMHLVLSLILLLWCFWTSYLTLLCDFLYFSRSLSLWTLLTSNLLHQDSLGEGDWGAAAASIHSHHADLQAVTGGLVLDDVAAGLLQILIDCFPVLSWVGKLRKMKIDWCDLQSCCLSWYYRIKTVIIHYADCESCWQTERNGSVSHS